MKDELKEIDSIPEFESDIDPHTLANIKTEESRALAVYMSKERQRSRWVLERTIEAYNLGVRNANFLKKYAPAIMFVFWLGTVVIAALASEWARSAFHGK